MFQIQVLVMTPIYTLYAILLAKSSSIHKYDKKVKYLALRLDMSLKYKYNYVIIFYVLFMICENEVK